MRRYWYYAKVQGSWLWLIIAVLLGAFLFMLLHDVFRAPRPAPRGIEDLSIVTEVVLAICAPLLCASVPALERENKLAEMHLSYHQPAWRRLLELLVLPVVLWCTALLLVGWTVITWYIPVDWGDILATGLPPAVALGGASLLGTALARH